MSEKNKYYTVVLIPDESDDPKTFRINRSLLKSLLIISVLTLLSVAVALAVILPRALGYKDLKSENQKLTMERFRVLRILDDYSRIKQRDLAIRRYLGLGLNLESPFGFIEAQSDTSPALLDSLMNLPLSVIPRRILPGMNQINFIENVPTTPPVQGPVTAGFSRSTIFLEDQHLGIDIAARIGDAVKAAAEGIVVFSGWTYLQGNTVIIYHGDDYFSVYGHNARNLVKSHEVVHRADPIALVGNTGLSRGPHLHFEIWKKDVPLDPRDFIPLYREKDISIH